MVGNHYKCKHYLERGDCSPGSWRGSMLVWNNFSGVTGLCKAVCYKKYISHIIEKGKVISERMSLVFGKEHISFSGVIFFTVTRVVIDERRPAGSRENFFYAVDSYRKKWHGSYLDDPMEKSIVQEIRRVGLRISCQRRIGGVLHGGGVLYGEDN